MSTATDFQDLIDALETNLQLMGVDDAEFDRSTGILGLVDKITDIEPSTNIDLDITCTLSSSENSIDYGESIVLTATLLASYDDTSANNVDLKTGEITGATIQFKQGNTVIGTGITNNNGVATLTYTPTTTGTLNITASFNGTLNFSRATSTGINVLVNETLTLTSDKTILSAADNESATLTATLHAVNNSGQTVTFEVRKVSDDSLVETLYGTTNSSGVATVSYLGKHAGNLYIKAIVNSVIQSVIYVTDLYYYNDGTKTNSFIIDSGASVTTNGEYLTLTTATSGGKQIQIPVTLDKDTDWSVEFEVAHIGVVQNFAFNIFINNKSSNMYFFDTIKGYFGTSNSGVSGWGDLMNSTDKPAGTVYTFKYENGVLSFMFNDTVFKSASVTLINPIILTFYTAQGRTQYIKNIKVKPL